MRFSRGHESGTRSDRTIGLVVLVAVLPLVVDLSQRSMPILQFFTGFGETDAAGTRLHLVLPLVAVLAVVALWRRNPSLRRPLPILLLLLLLQFTISITTGMLGGAGLVGFVFYVQTIVPLVAWLAMYRLAPSPRVLARAVMTGVLIVLVCALIYTAFNGGVADAYYSSIELEDPVPQYRAYFPALVALAVAMAVAFFHTDRYLSVATVAGSLLVLPIMWSRAGICMVVVALVASIFFCHFRGMSWRRRLAVAGTTGIVLGVLALTTLSVGLTSQRTELNDLQASDSDRVALAQESTGRIVGNPLTGDAFAANGSDLVGGAVASFDRLFPSHNQYLDYGIRAGVPAFLLLVAFLAWSVWSLIGRWIKQPTGPIEPLYGAMLGFLMALIPAALTELYLSQTWTGVAIMMILGATAGRLELDRAGWRSVTDARQVESPGQ